MTKVERWIELEVKDTADSEGMWAVYTNGRYVERFLVGHHTYSGYQKQMDEQGFQLVCYAKDGKRYEP